MERTQSDHEKATRLNDEHTRMLTRAEKLARMGSWRWEPGKNVLVWSNELYYIYGIESGSPVTFETFIGAIHPEDRDRVRDTILGAMKDRKSFRILERVIRPSGDERILDSQGEVELDENGAVISLSGFCRDITEEAHSQEAFREQKELYEQLLKAQSDVGEGVAITDGTMIVYANEALSRMYGYSVDELRLLPSMLDLVVPEERDRLMDRLKRRMGGEKIDSLGETQIVRKDGRLIVTEYSAKPVQIKGKTLLISIIRDITDRRRAEEALQEREQKFAKIFHMSPTASSVTTFDDGRFLEVNSRFLEITGYKREELIGKTVQIIKLRNSVEEHQRLMRSLSEVESMREIPVIYRKKDGSTNKALASIQLLDVGGKQCLLTILWRV